jgi:acyl carrier protein
MPDPILEPQLRKVLTEICQKDLSTVSLDADLIMELGLDSLAGLRLLAALEKKFQIRFPDHRLGEFRTMRQLLDFLETQPGEPT